MKKISRRNFLLASGAVTIGAALAACGGSSASTVRIFVILRSANRRAHSFPISLNRSMSI